MNQVGICNMALGWLGATAITSLTDVSTNAELCSANWDAAMDAVLEAKEWTWAVKRDSLTVAGGAPAWGYSRRYQLPSDVVRVLQAGDGQLESNIEWVREGAYLLTDYEGPLQIRYVSRITDPTIWSAGFVVAMALRLAAHMSIALTENRSREGDLWQLYERQLLKGGALDGMQGRSERRRMSAIVSRRW